MRSPEFGLERAARGAVEAVHPGGGARVVQGLGELAVRAVHGDVAVQVDEGAQVVLARNDRVEALERLCGGLAGIAQGFIRALRLCAGEARGVDEQGALVGVVPEHEGHPAEDAGLDLAQRRVWAEVVSYRGRSPMISFVSVDVAVDRADELHRAQALQALQVVGIAGGVGQNCSGVSRALRQQDRVRLPRALGNGRSEEAFPHE
mmetsp:Transcript_7404/g.13375  ORF Transcript_7404/g.13375 Transcript_7404/m.13375 type:complete len:205 (-) Transcript_7404:1060-1674(-)